MGSSNVGSSESDLHRSTSGLEDESDILRSIDQKSHGKIYGQRTCFYWDTDLIASSRWALERKLALNDVTAIVTPCDVTFTRRHRQSPTT